MLKIELLSIVLDTQNKKRRSIKSGCGLRKNKRKQKGHSKVNRQIKHKIYTWITRHPQVVQSPMSSYCIKVIFDDRTEPQMVPKLLLHVYLREGGPL